MKSQSLILAAHGSGADSIANARLSAIAEMLHRRGDYTEVLAAFKLGEPTYADALAGLHSDDVSVIPVMAGDGYYRRVVLPRELRPAAASAGKRVRIAQSVGTHARIEPLFAHAANEIMARFSMPPAETAVVVVGHGTKRDSRSRIATEALRDVLAQVVSAASVVVAFLDEEPLVESLPTMLKQPNVILVPHLIGGGHHVLRDIPARLAIELPLTQSQATLAIADGRRWVFAPPLMEHPDFVDLILDRANGPLDELDDLSINEAAPTPGRSLPEATP